MRLNNRRHPLFFRRAIRGLALFLALGLALPSPAFALRPTNAGMEESPVSGQIKQKLHPATGLEEDGAAGAQPLSKEKAELQMEQFLKAMEIGRSEQGYQRGAIVDLRHLLKEKRVIFVGDMHASPVVLRRVIRDENFEGDENAVLIVTGDALHEEKPADRLQMDSSVSLMQLLMELKIRHPTRFYYLLGNHDWPSIKVGTTEVGKRYFLRLGKLYGEEYEKQYQRFLTQSPILAIGDRFVAVHAGPILNANLDQIQNVDMKAILSSNRKADPVLYQALFGGAVSIDGIHRKSVTEFLNNLRLPLYAKVISSHYHRQEMPWHQLLLARYWDKGDDGNPKEVNPNTWHNIYAGFQSNTGRWGYARYQYGVLETVRHGNETFVSQRPEESARLREGLTAGTLNPAEFVDAVLAPFHTVPEPPHGLAAPGYRPLGVPVDEKWIPMLWRMSEAEIVRATGAEPVRQKAREAVDEFLSRIKGEPVPGQPLRGMSDNVAIEMMLEILRAATGTADPYAALKREYNEKALSYLDRMWQAVQESQDPVRMAVALGIIGNAIDFAAPEQRTRLERNGFSFETEIERARGLSFVRDQRSDFLAALEGNPTGEVLFLVDNAGEIVFDLPLIKLMLQQGRGVILAGKSLPHANDMTAGDLRALFAEKRVQDFIGADRMNSLKIIASGTAMTGLDLRRATPELAAAWRSAPVIYAKGQGMVETLRYAPLLREVFHAVMVKDPRYFHEKDAAGKPLPLRNGDVLFLRTPATAGLEEPGSEHFEPPEEIGRPEVPTNRRALLLGGVGNIGRGHIAPMLSRDDYDIFFVDFNRSLIAAANERDSYVVTPVGRGDPVTVRNFWGIDAQDQNRVAAQGPRADWIFTTVGTDNIIKLQNVVYHFIRNRITARHFETLNIVFAENLPIDQPQIAALRQAVLNLSDDTTARYIKDRVNFIGAPPVEDFREYEQNHVGWPGAVVSITVPPTLVKQKTGNPLDISVEGGGPYELVVDGKELKNTRFVPSGIRLVNNIRAAREKKLLIHNMGHAAFAYLAWILGMKPEGNPALAIRKDPRIGRIVRRAMEESAAGLLHRYPAEFTRAEMDHYLDELLDRFANIELNDTVERIARDPLRKLAKNDRLIGAAISAREAGVAPQAILLAVAAAIRYARAQNAPATDLQAIQQQISNLGFSLPRTDDEFWDSFNRLSAAWLEEKRMGRRRLVGGVVGAAASAALGTKLASLAMDRFGEPVPVPLLRRAPGNSRGYPSTPIDPPLIIGDAQLQEGALERFDRREYEFFRDVSFSVPAGTPHAKLFMPLTREDGQKLTAEEYPWLLVNLWSSTAVNVGRFRATAVTEQAVHDSEIGFVEGTPAASPRGNRYVIQLVSDLRWQPGEIRGIELELWAANPALAMEVNGFKVQPGRITEYDQMQNNRRLQERLTEKRGRRQAARLAAGLLGGITGFWTGSAVVERLSRKVNTPPSADLKKSSNREIAAAGQVFRELRVTSAEQTGKAHILYNEATLASLFFLSTVAEKMPLSSNIAVVDPLRQETLRAIAASAGFKREVIDYWAENYLVVFNPDEPGAVDLATKKAEELIAQRLSGIRSNDIVLISTLPKALDQFGLKIKALLRSFGISFRSDALTNQTIQALYNAAQA